MFALGELLIYFINAILGLGTLLSLLSLIFVKPFKLIYLLTFVVSTFLLILFVNNNRKNYKAAQLNHVGEYTLTNYPNCPTCILIFKEDNSFEVKDNNSKILEKGDWQYIFGHDYFIVYINDKEDRLGHERFRYNSFRKKAIR